MVSACDGSELPSSVSLAARGGKDDVNGGEDECAWVVLDSEPPHSGHVLLKQNQCIGC